MTPDSSIHEALKGLDGVLWRDTMFADLQWYYAEEGVYVLRCKHGEPNEHLCVIRAKSANEAISRAVFDLHKAGEKKKSKPSRNCDRFNTGDLKRDAQDAMEAMLDEGVAGFRGMAEYLLSPVCTERKGEGDGSK